MKNFLMRLSSRKFLATVFGLAVLAENQQWTEFTALLLGYVAAEGGADVVTRLKGGISTLNGYVNPTSQNDDNGVDESKVISGKPSATPLFNEEVKE